MLDAAGWTECRIIVSNSLDEYLIRELLRQGAEIDAFGVGERLITAKSDPVFGGVYKLVAVEEADGAIIPKIKISDNPEKVTNPHFKKVWRLYEEGKAVADLLTLYDEVIDTDRPLEIFDPEYTWKRKTLTEFEAKELLVPIFRGGELVYQSPALPEIAAYCDEQVARQWDEVKRFDNPHNYYVDLSQNLWDLKHDLLKEKR
jgi:nicotinate phosphoribosyltransferase